MRHQHIRTVTDQYHLREITRRVVRQLGIKRGIYRVPRRDNQQRVTIGRGFRHQFRTNDGIAATAVIDDELLARLGDVVEPEQCADMTLDAMRAGTFLVLPHPRVADSFLRKANDYDQWLAGTNRRLRRMRGEDV